MSKKDLQIRNLSKNRYRELKYLCLQYGELKVRLREIVSEDIKGVIITGMPSAHNISNPTQDIVLKKFELERKITAIEQAAIDADRDIYKYILKAVTEDMPYEFLGVPCGRRQFYKKRRMFFTILDEKI